MKMIADLLVNGAAWAVGNSLAASALAMVILALTRISGDRLHPRLVAALWIVVGLRLVLPVAPTAGFGLFPDFAGLVPSSALTMSVLPSSVAEGPLDSVAIPGAGTNSPAEALASPLSAGPSHSPFWILGLAMLWLFVAITILLRAMLRQQSLAKQIHRLPEVQDDHLRDLLPRCSAEAKIATDFRYVLTPPGTGVAVFGGLRATHLLIPSDLVSRHSPTEIRGILLHELAHVRRHDLTWNWIALAIQSLHWFNPLAWIAGRRFLVAREALCDRYAVSQLSEEGRRTYGAALVKALEHGFTRRSPQSLPSLAPLYSSPTELKHRLTMILNPRPPRLSIQLGAAALVCSVSLITFTTATIADETTRARGSDRVREVEASPRSSPRNGEDERASGSREGETRRSTGPRDGETRREGPRDGETRRSTGPRDGETRREGPRDGETRRSTGPRDGEQTREGGGRDRESSVITTSDRDITQWSRIYAAYDKDGDRAVTFEEWVSMKNYELTSAQREREQGWFNQADGNQDNKISLGEWIDWKASQGRQGRD